ncbi:hypothetical protein B0H11DRAFT_1032572 [Mycena galericulata]|nr:hypothetical protein B0H11DRAFT_1032572 [Mycena galericulata]
MMHRLLLRVRHLSSCASRPAPALTRTLAAWREQQLANPHPQPRQPPAAGAPRLSLPCRVPSSTNLPAVLAAAFPTFPPTSFPFRSHATGKSLATSTSSLSPSSGSTAARCKSSWATCSDSPPPTHLPTCARSRTTTPPIQSFSSPRARNTSCGTGTTRRSLASARILHRTRIFSLVLLRWGTSISSVSWRTSRATMARSARPLIGGSGVWGGI